jgi:hypothetical protein
MLELGSNDGLRGIPLELTFENPRKSWTMLRRNIQPPGWF